MKLRNKRTGEIREDSDLGKMLSRYNMRSFDSISELCKEWEDYEPKEPLIKDEKIRKAVRAWADAIGVEDLFYCIDHRTRRAVFSWPGNDIAMELPVPVEGLDTGRVYTIAELCGEEEECQS